MYKSLVLPESLRPVGAGANAVSMAGDDGLTQRAADKMKGTSRSGTIGLYVDIGTEGYSSIHPGLSV